MGMRSARTGRSPRGTKTLAVAFLATLVFGLSLGSPSSKAAYTLEPGITYAGDSPSNPGLNQLDLYRPQTPAAGLSPLVIYVHGGGWRRGDKANAGTLDKANLFTGAGYFFASINYRLSPESGDPQNPDPNRIRFPVHPQDVGKAVGWLNANALGDGIDPDRIILIGHSAGAHLVSLVSTDPSYIEANGVDPRQVIGTIPLDTGAFDVEGSVNGDNPDEPNLLFTNAFGTAEENAVDGSWAAASPLTWADGADPEHLFITQLNPRRLAVNLEMATALGQGPETVVQVPLNHNGINAAVGKPGDTSGTTAAITSFVSARLAAFQPAAVSIKKRPARVVKVGWKRKAGKLRPKTRTVRFAFAGSGAAAGFMCRLDQRPFRDCGSPRRYEVGKGGHTFRVRPLYPSGRGGTDKVFKFKVKTKKKPRR